MIKEWIFIRSQTTISCIETSVLSIRPKRFTQNKNIISSFLNFVREKLLMVNCLSEKKLSDDM